MVSRIKGIFALDGRAAQEADALFRIANAVNRCSRLIWSVTEVLFQDQTIPEWEAAPRFNSCAQDAGPIYYILFSHCHSPTGVPDAENILRPGEAN